MGIVGLGGRGKDGREEKDHEKAESGERGLPAEEPDGGESGGVGTGVLAPPPSGDSGSGRDGSKEDEGRESGADGPATGHRGGSAGMDIVDEEDEDQSRDDGTSKEEGDTTHYRGERGFDSCLSLGR